MDSNTKPPKRTVAELQAIQKQRLLDKGYTEEQIAASEEKKAANVKAFMDAKRSKA